MSVKRRLLEEEADTDLIQLQRKITDHIQSQGENTDLIQSQRGNFF
jgi:hypothetical protein